jgi:preprotein translocase subunit SecF
MSEEQTHEESKRKNWYEKHYKLLLIIPAILLIFSIVYLFQFNSQNGDIVFKDVSLTGGTTITVFDKETNIDDLESSLSIQFPDLIVRSISDITTGKQQAFFVETSVEPEEIKTALENYLGYSLNEQNSSIEFSGESLSSGFYQQLRLAVLIAFLFMAAVVFFIFKSPIPSLAVIISAFADIIFTIVIINFFGITLSIGGIVALLMLVGYSVDTDILLTSRVLRKREGTLNERMFGAFKTGLTMTLTSIAAMAVALIIIYSFSDTLRQIFTILLIGLGFDIFNTWITNASILRWYAEKRGLE